MISEIPIIFEFKESGKFLMSMSGFGESESLTGVWELDGSILKTRDTGEGEWKQFEIILSREKLIMKNGKESLGFKRVRQTVNKSLKLNQGKKFIEGTE